MDELGCMQWIDWSAEYSADKKTIKKAIKYRLKKQSECQERWPMYASYAEDAKFQNKVWNNHFDHKDGPCVVMHDMSNIELPAPSSGDLNQALHNAYYGMCCVKAGVAMQLAVCAKLEIGGHKLVADNLN
jgi:hypothetical protein